VLLSSHLLHEIEGVAEDLVVIGNGRIVAQGTKDDLLRSAGTIVRTTRRSVVQTALDRAGVRWSTTGDDGLLAHAETGRVGEIAFAAGVPLLELRPADGAGLEEMFLRLTADTQREGRVA
jgi:ABC-2 type transport system ATP-binding protein